MKKRTKEILKVSIALVVIIAISVVLFFVGKALGVTDIDSLHALIKSFGVWGWLVFLIIQVVTTVLLCFIPATSMTFTALGILLYGANWKAFVLVFSGIIISSYIMYLMGRFGGYKLVNKLIGEEDTKKATDLIRNRGQVYFPAMMCAPLFPDDALCFVAGVSKMNIWFYSFSILVGRGIGCATIVFGINLIPYQEFTTLYEWFVCVSCIAIWVVIILTILRKIDKWLDNRRKKKKDNGNNTK